MRLLVIFIVFIQIIFQSYSCSVYCQTCFADNQYSCTSCPTLPKSNIYIWSCQSEDSSAIFLSICIIITVLYTFMLLLGYGMYHNIFQNIQLVSLISWGYGSQSGISSLQGTNFGTPMNNSFPQSFGGQFIAVMILLGFFWILVIGMSRLPHNALATLIKRKKIIFPVRIYQLFFTIIVFSSILEIGTLNTQSQIKIFGLVLAILALLKIICVTIWLLIVANRRNFEIDDPGYYVLIQKLSTKRWYARNNLALSAIFKGAIILVFILNFNNPESTGLAITILQLIYTILLFFSLKFIKMRYRLINLAGSILTLFIYFSSYECAVTDSSNSKWQTFRKLYLALVLILCGLLLIALLIQIAVNSNLIKRQVKSMIDRFIICQKLQDKVEMTKFDEDRNRQKVTTFRANLIYDRQSLQKQERQASF